MCCVCVLCVCVVCVCCVCVVCVKLMYVKFVCVKLLYVKFIVVYVRRREGEAGGGEGARDTESKTRTPHKDVGIKVFLDSPMKNHGFWVFLHIRGMGVVIFLVSHPGLHRFPRSPRSWTAGGSGIVSHLRARCGSQRI